jgi:hypothetical protein
MGPRSRRLRTAGRMTGPHVLCLPLDGHVLEVEITAEQAAHIKAGKAIAWYSPEVPDITVDDDGTITAHEDARPRIP